MDDFGDVSGTEYLPVFTIPDVPEQMDDDGWSDSDDDFNLTGEYTGKYKMVTVPIKADPPTSGTRGRMESWGRPVSPFPYSEILERSLPVSDLTEDDIFGDVDTHEVPLAGDDQGTESGAPPAAVEPRLSTATSARPVRPNHALEEPSDGEVDPDVVKVTSGGATTAARAAAILKLVHACFITSERMLTFLAA